MVTGARLQRVEGSHPFPGARSEMDPSIGKAHRSAWFVPPAWEGCPYLGCEARKASLRSSRFVGPRESTRRPRPEACLSAVCRPRSQVSRKGSEWMSM